MAPVHITVGYKPGSTEPTLIYCGTSGQKAQEALARAGTRGFARAELYPFLHPRRVRKFPQSAPATKVDKSPEKPAEKAEKPADKPQEKPPQPPKATEPVADKPQQPAAKSSTAKAPSDEDPLA